MSKVNVMKMVSDEDTVAMQANWKTNINKG